MTSYLRTISKDLLLLGANTTGSFVEGYYYIEEELYIDEAEELHAFCEWIDKEIGGASRLNIDTLWLTFKNPKDKGLADEANKIAEEIKRIKSLIK